MSLVEFIPTSVSLTAIDARSAAPSGAAVPVAIVAIAVYSVGLRRWSTMSMMESTKPSRPMTAGSDCNFEVPE